jgi:hypothetical protein
MFKPGTSKTGLLIYIDAPSGRAVQDLDPAEREHLCALGYINCSGGADKKVR